MGGVGGWEKYELRTGFVTGMVMVSVIYWFLVDVE